MQIWNATSKNPALIYRNHTKPVSAVAWSPDGSRIVSGSWDTTVQVWDVQTGRRFATYRGYSQQVSTVAWSPDGAYIASGSWDATIQVRQAESGSRLFTYQGHSSPVHAVAWSPTRSSPSLEGGWRIASASGDTVNADIDNTVHIWHALTGSNPLIYRDHFYFVKAVAWSPDGKKIASA